MGNVVLLRAIGSDFQSKLQIWSMQVSFRELPNRIACARQQNEINPSFFIYFRFFAEKSVALQSIIMMLF